MRRKLLPALAGLLVATACLPAPAEPLAFKGLELGGHYPAIARMDGMACARPQPRPVDRTLPKLERNARAEASRLYALVEGDLVCQWKRQTIAGKPIRSAKLTIYGDVLERVELELAFPMTDLNWPRERRTAARSDINEIVQALAIKYGPPRHTQQYSSRSLDRDAWYLPNGEIVIERVIDLPYEASVVFTAKTYESHRVARWSAAHDIDTALLNARLQKAEDQRAKNAKDL